MARGMLLYLAIAGQPRFTRVAWVGLFAGISVLAAACIVQHCTVVTRWYADLDCGWAAACMRKRGRVARIDLLHQPDGPPSWLPHALLLLPPLLRRRADRRLRALAAPRRRGDGCRSLVYRFTRSDGGAGHCRLPVPLAPVLALGMVCPAGLVSVYPGWPARPLCALAALVTGCLLVYTAIKRNWRLLLALTLVRPSAGGLQVLDAYVLHFPLHWRVIDKGLSDIERVQLNREEPGTWRAPAPGTAEAMPDL